MAAIDSLKVQITRLEAAITQKDIEIEQLRAQLAGTVNLEPEIQAAADKVGQQADRVAGI